MKKLIMIPLLLLLGFFALGNMVLPPGVDEPSKTTWERDGNYMYQTLTVYKKASDNRGEWKIEVSSPKGTTIEYYDHSTLSYEKITNSDKYIESNSVYLYYKISLGESGFDWSKGVHSSYIFDPNEMPQLYGQNNLGYHFKSSADIDIRYTEESFTFRYHDPFDDNNDRPPMFSGQQRIHNVIAQNNSIQDIIKKAGITVYDVIDGDLTKYIAIEYDEFSGQSNKVGSYRVILKVKNSKDLVSYYELIISNEDGVTEEDEDVFPEYGKYEVSEIGDLPKTAKGVLANVYYRINHVRNFFLEIKIVYSQRAYYLNYSFTNEQDMDLFRTNESYYINTEEPQIFINHSDREYLKDMIQATNNQKPTFVPHTIWDLETNEIETSDKYAANVYIKTNKKTGVLYSYVYIDEYIIDQIISIHLKWNSRVKKTNVFGGEKYTDWTQQDLIFTGDEYLEYKNLTGSWEYSVPFWNIIRLIYDNVKTYKVPRIDSFDINNINSKVYDVTQIELLSYFSRVNPNFEEFNNDPRYKLHAIALEEESINKWGQIFSSKKTEFYNNPDIPDDPNNFQILNINYITDGKLYTAVGNDMNIYIEEHPDDSATTPQDPVRGFIEKALFLGIAGLSISILSGAGFFRTRKGKEYMALVKLLLIGAVIFISWNWFINYKYFFDAIAIILRL